MKRTKKPSKSPQNAHCQYFRTPPGSVFKYRADLVAGGRLIGHGLFDTVDEIRTWARRVARSKGYTGVSFVRIG